MAICTFNEGIEQGMSFVLRPGCKNESIGVFSNIRVDRKTVPEGWFAYDIRDGESGNFCSIEKNNVFVNHAGTFLTQTPIRFPKERDWMSMSGRGGYSFL